VRRLFWLPLWVVTVAVIIMSLAVFQPAPRPRPAVPDVPGEHGFVVAALRAARAGGDLDRAAELQGRLADRAFSAAERTARTWMGLRDPRFGLLPREVAPAAARWNYADVAADCYSHIVIAAHLLAPDLLPALRDMLEVERRISPEFASVNLATGEVAAEDANSRYYGAVEYAKDGLLPILESLGETPWAERLNQVVEQVWTGSSRATGGGTVVLDKAEKNGEMLQLLARLWHRTRDPRYLARGRGIVEAYINQVFPLTQGLVPRIFDFAAGRVRDARIGLRDHGNEMIAGLVEWILVERAAPDSRTAAYAPAVERLLDRLLEDGRRRNGLWLNVVGEGGRATDLLNDTWGYLASAYAAYSSLLAEGDPRRARYLAAARQSLSAAATQRGANWEYGRMDGFADSIEGALYVIAIFDEPAAEDWVDEEIGRLLAYAGPDGFVGGNYLDGNFIRTCLLYALWKTAGIRPVPWQRGLRIGAERDDSSWRISVETDEPWQGVVRFDGSRHRETLQLTENYPRLNSWPEWLAVEAGTIYQLEDRTAASPTSISGADLRRGWPVSLNAGERLAWRLRRIGVPGPP